MTKEELKKLFKNPNQITNGTLKLAESYCKDYKLEKIISKNGELIFLLKDANSINAKLYIDDGDIVLKKDNNSQLEVYRIRSDSSVIKTVLESRKNGLLVDNTKIVYDNGDNKKEPIILCSERYAISNYAMNKYYSNMFIKNISSEYDCLYDLNDLYDSNVYKVLHYYSEIISSFDIYANIGYPVLGIKYPCSVMLNGEDISKIYGSLMGSNLVLRIYDLYKGNVTQTSIDDIKSIYSGILEENAFGLEEISIKKIEDSLIGQGNHKYKESEKKLLENTFNYKSNKEITNAEDVIEYMNDAYKASIFDYVSGIQDYEKQKIKKGKVD